MDTVDGIGVTLIDDGMPCVLLRATDFGITGTETPQDLESNQNLKTKLETLRLRVGERMNLGDVTDKSVPKMTLLSAPQNGGLINTRSFIPHRCHKNIGVMAAVTAASACLQKGTVADGIAATPCDNVIRTHHIEHPTGSLPVVERTLPNGETDWFATPRSARKLMDGTVYPREEP